MEMDGYKRSLLKTIRKRQLQFFGLINRADRLGKQILSGKICGSKSIGRQRAKSTHSLNDFVTRKETPNNEFVRRTDDGEGWKAMIADVITDLAHDDDNEEEEICKMDIYKSA